MFGSYGFYLIVQHLRMAPTSRNLDMEPGLTYPGGTKKFLYTGPASKRRGTQFDDDVDDHEWNFQQTVDTGIPSNGNKSSEFDFDGVWSIKKNVNVPNTMPNGTQSMPGPHDGLNVNVGTSYYSRHGALLGDNSSDKLGKVAKSGGTGAAGKSWGQGNSHNFSYAQGDQTFQASGPTLQSSPNIEYEAQTQRQGNGNLFKTGGIHPGGIHPGGRHDAQNTGKYNNNRHF